MCANQTGARSLLVQFLEHPLGTARRRIPGWVAISRSPLRAARRRQRGFTCLRRTRSIQLSFCYELSYRRNESDGYFHCGAFQSRFNFGGGFFITLGLVVFEHTTDSSLIPSAEIFFGSHLFCLRLRRIARFACGPNAGIITPAYVLQRLTKDTLTSCSDVVFVDVWRSRSWIGVVTDLHRAILLPIVIPTGLGVRMTTRALRRGSVLAVASRSITACGVPI